MMSLFLTTLLLLAQSEILAPPEASTGILIGDTFDYTVREGQTLFLIGARFGVDWQTLANLNALEAPDELATSERLRIDNRHVVPQPSFDTGILVNIPQRMLFYFVDRQLLGAWPAGVGRPDWETPQGLFRIVTLEEDPTWDVPVSIQEEMRREGRSVDTQVPPGPDNPLGEFWIGLSEPGLGIHGTNMPSSVYGFVTHGCVRLHPDDIRSLFTGSMTGMPVEIIYQPVLATQLADGRIFVEAHRDVYRLGTDDGQTREVLERWVATLSSGAVGDSTIRTILEERAGIAELIKPSPVDGNQGFH